MFAVTDAMPETAPMMEAMTAPASEPPAAPQRAAPPAASRASLFAEAPQLAAPAGQTAPDAARPSLFSTVTGAFRRRLTSGTTHASRRTVRAEPVLQEPRTGQPRASVRQTGRRGSRARYSRVPAPPIVVAAGAAGRSTYDRAR